MAGATPAIPFRKESSMANLEDLFSGFNSRKSSEDAVRYGEELDATAPIRPASKSSTTIPRAESMAPYAIRAEETPRPDTSFESRLLRALQWIADNREILAETADGLNVSEDSFTKWLALLSVLSEIVQFG